MARKKKNPTPSLLAGTPAPGSNGRTPEGVRPHLTETVRGDVATSEKAGTPGTAERNAQRSGPRPCAPFREGVGTPGTAERRNARRRLRLTVRIVLEGDSLALLLRNVPAGETPESAARVWLLRTLEDFEDSLRPLEGEEDPDPRRGLRAIPGGRSAAVPDQ